MGWDLENFHCAPLGKIQPTCRFQNLRRLIKETRLTLEKTRAERERRNRVTQFKIERKEEEHRLQMAQLTKHYGTKIEELTTAVQLLQSQLQVE